MRSILHVDLNCFYASVEQAERPELRGLPIIVGGNEESRHGIVLTASYPAKRRGVKTAMTLWQARRVCPEAIIVPPHYDLYMRYSKIAREIYNDYSDLVEPFGLDEAWIDLTHSIHLFGGSATLVAREIAERMVAELGCTVSIGLSWNKIYAKFGSDYRKPDGFTMITPDNAPDIVWPAPARSLLYVGPATERKLAKIGIYTIGDLACTDDATLQRSLGKMGLVLATFARGSDNSPVRVFEPHVNDIEHIVKSVGNGITLPFDVEDPQTASQVAWLMGESVAQRLRMLGLAAQVVSAYGRDATTLAIRNRQVTLSRPTQLTSEICTAASELLLSEWDFVRGEKIRAIGVRGAKLSPAEEEVQFDIFGDEHQRQRKLALDHTIDDLRRRFGNHAVRRLVELANPKLTTLDPQKDNVIHPVSYFA